MNIGIIGSGNMGGALGALWAKNGHQVLFSYSRDESKLRALAEGARPNARTGTPEEAAEFGEVVMLSVAPPALEDALRVAPLLSGKTLISCVSGLRPDFSGQTVGMPTALTLSIAEQVAALAPDAHVVEAFNTTFAETISAPSRDFGGQRPSVFYCGDAAEAKTVVAALIEECGYEALDAGPLHAARALETLASVWVQMAVVGNLFPEVAFKALRR